MMTYIVIRAYTELTSEVSSYNCSFCNLNNFSNISKFCSCLFLLFSANNSVNFMVLILLGSKHEVS